MKLFNLYISMNINLRDIFIKILLILLHITQSEQIRIVQIRLD